MEPRATQVERELDPPLRKIIIPKVQQILEPILELLSHEEEEIRKAAQRTNGLLLKILDRERRNNSIEFVNVVHVVKDLIKRPEKTAE
jgi:vacuole morphology and inheritance protein 14